MSVMKPRRPRLMPTTGRPSGASVRAMPSMVPSPPTMMPSSARRAERLQRAGAAVCLDQDGDAAPLQPALRCWLQDVRQPVGLGTAEQGDGLEAGGHPADYTIIQLSGINICGLW